MASIYNRIENAEKEIANLQSTIASEQEQKRDNVTSLANFALQEQHHGVATAAAATMIPSLRPNIKARRVLKGHYGKVAALHWCTAANGTNVLVSAGQDGNLIFWNALTSNKLQAIPLKSSYVMAVGLEQSSGQADLVACGGLDNLCTIYSRKKCASNTNSSNNSSGSFTKKELVELAGHDGFVSCCRFTDTTHIVTSSGDSTLIYWDFHHDTIAANGNGGGTPVSTLAEHSSDVMFLDLQPGNNNILASCSVDSTIKLWDLRETNEGAVQTLINHHNADVNCVAFLPGEPHALVSCGVDETVRLFDLRSGCPQVAKFGNNNNMEGDDPSIINNDGYSSLAISNSGRVVFAGHTNGSIAAYDLLSPSGNTSNSFIPPAYMLSSAHDRNVSCLGVTPDGTALCSGSWDNVLKVWA